jgi:putative DNA primase/helicase
MAKASAKPKFEKKTQATIYKEAAQHIIEAIKAGTAPWMKPWDAESAQAFMRPHNAITKKNYASINTVMLMSRGYADPRWMTFNQAKEKGWNVRKGEKSTQIYFFKPIEVETEERDAKNEKIKRKIPILKTFAMFNATQIDGVPALEAAPRGFEAVDAAETIMTGCGTSFEYGGDALTYHVGSDTVRMPPKASFLDRDYFYAAAMHGAARGTAHPSRLNRETAEFTDNPILCAREEMRVEIAAMMLSADLGLMHDPSNHVAYVAQWIEMLESDPKEIFRAARDAEAIRRHLFAIFQPEAEASLVADAAVAGADATPEAPGNDSIMSALDSALDMTEPVAPAADAPQDAIEEMIFAGNAADTISTARQATGKLDTGLDFGDLDVLLGIAKPKPTDGPSM